MPTTENFVPQPNPDFAPTEHEGVLPIADIIKPNETLDETESYVLNVFDDSIEQDNGKVTTKGLSDYLVARSAGKGYLLIDQVGGRPPSIKQGTKTEFDGWRWWGGDWQSHTMNVFKASLLATVVVNGAINAKSFLTDVREETRIASDSIGEAVDSAIDALPWNDDRLTLAEKAAAIAARVEIECSTETGPTVQETLFIPTSTEAGSREFTEAQVNQLGEAISELQDDERITVSALSISGSASDEWGNTRLGIPNDGNERLADDRASSYLELLSETSSINLGDITINPGDNSEAILDDAEIKELTILSSQFGYDSPDTARAIYDNPDTIDQLPPQLKAALDIYFGEKRGVNITISYTVNGETVETCVPILQPEEIAPETPEDKREDTNNDYRFIPILLPVPPLPSWRSRPTTRVIPGQEPTTVTTKVTDDTFVKLYPRALQTTDVMTSDGKEQTVFSDDAWAWTRKYQALLRDDRIEAALTHRYIDQENTERSLRVVFVDHKPNEATIQAFSELLEDTAQLRDGDVSENLHAIAVFPSDNAGAQKTPAQIGLGIDEQYEENTLGVAIPTLGLVEMHMPTDPSKAELDALEGARWVFAHEVGGHFTDVNEPRVEAVALNGIRDRMRRNRAGDPDVDYATRMPWAETAKSLFKTLKRERLSSWGDTYEVTTQHQDLNGRIDQNTTNVTGGNNIDYATTIRKVGFPTEYAATHEAETYAETAAQVLTGIELPVPNIKPNRDGFEFAQGAHVDSRLARMFGRRVHANFVLDDEFSPVFSLDNEAIDQTGQTVYADSIAQDPELLRLSRAARITPLPAEDELITVKAKVVGVNPKK